MRHRQAQGLAVGGGLQGPDPIAAVCAAEPFHPDVGVAAAQLVRAGHAEARGDAKAARTASESAATYREWLAQAQKAVEDFSG